MPTDKKRPRGAAAASGAALTLGAALAAGQPAQAATFTVTNLDDDGPGSLRQAVNDANAAAGADVIDFQPGLTGAIVLSTGQLAVNDSVEIQGPGATDLAVFGNYNRVFYLYNPAALLDVTISGLTIGGGEATDGGGIADIGENLVLDGVTLTGNHAINEGGGLFVLSGGKGDSATITIRQSTISGNSADVNGGGIKVRGAYLPAVLIEDSVIAGNFSGQDGAGIHLPQLQGSFTLQSSTVSGNIAGDAGGGIYLYNLYGGSLTARNSTIAANSAGGAGGGLFVQSGGASIEDSIVGDNTAGADNDLATGAEASVDLRYTLVESPGAANINDNGGNIFNQDPQLGPLGNNGGPTQTQVPAGTSPAIDAGDPAFVPPPSTDQRGFQRVRNGRLDMGAVEINPGQIQLSASAASAGENAGTVTITVTRTGGTDGDVSVSFATSDGTAVAPADYLAALGVLNWASGDGAPKTFQVTIVNDASDEPDETFNVTLSNP
ncbi:MAG: choice-of-anchor Q domain-containing protein, partial [Thermoanaerobaculia bacterium]